MTDRPLVDKKLAKDVAKHLDRRQVRRKILLWGGLVAAIVLAILYGTCGAGWGLGKGKGDGAGSGSARPLVSTIDAGPQVCEIVISGAGITVNDERMTRDAAVARCKPIGRAAVIVAGDTIQGDWDDLEAALGAAGIKVFKQQPKRVPAGSGSGAAGSGTSAPTTAPGSNASPKREPRRDKQRDRAKPILWDGVCNPNPLAKGCSW